MHLVDNRRHNKIQHHPEQHCKLEQSDEDGQHSALQPQQSAVVLHERLKQVCYKAGHEKGEKHIFQQVDEPDYSCYDGDCDYQSHHTVECVWLGRIWHDVDELQ